MARKYFTKEEEETIVAAIKNAEMATSGEIRVHIEKYCKINVLDRAAEVFSILEMHKTKQRNGVLFYLAILDKQFAIIGDKGINEKIKDHYWGDVKEHLIARFKNNEFTLGLKEAITMTGQQLKDYFPAHENEENELADEISFGA